MPTGYTADIENGITFNQFVLNCARAFGALVTMRDEPNDAEIPDKFETADWNLRELNKAKVEIKRLSTLTTEQATQESLTEYNLLIEQRNKSIADNKELLRKYRAMLKQVNEWQPPTTEHIELKNFMVSQITESIKFDGMLDYYVENPIVKLSGTEWLSKLIAKIARDITYHTEEYAKEVERTNSRNAWIKALRNSLKAEVKNG